MCIRDSVYPAPPAPALFFEKICKKHKTYNLEKKIIDGSKIKCHDSNLAIPSNGLHTNGYSLARKLFFDIGKYDVRDEIPKLEKSVGLTLLEPHINYTNHINNLVKSDIEIKGIAHITGGGLIENIPRILPDLCAAKIDHDSIELSSAAMPPTYYFNSKIKNQLIN